MLEKHNEIENVPKVNKTKRNEKIKKESPVHREKDQEVLNIVSNRKPDQLVIFIKGLENLAPHPFSKKR